MSRGPTVRPGPRPIPPVPVSPLARLTTDLFGETSQCFGGGGIRIADDDRSPGVRVGDDARRDRNLREQRDAELTGEARASAGAEQGRALAAMRAFDPAHVLDDPDDRDTDVLEHLCAAQRITG